MSDWEYAEAFKALREEGRKKRAGNRLSSLEILTREGVEHRLLSHDHVRVGDYDFWPSTGLFIHLKTKRRGRGVFNLLRKVRPVSEGAKPETKAVGTEKGEG